MKVLDDNTVEMRVWERGSGETLACGTGACAVAVASILNGYVKERGSDSETARRGSEDRVGGEGEPGLYDWTGSGCV